MKKICKKENDNERITKEAIWTDSQWGTYNGSTK